MSYVGRKGMIARRSRLRYLGFGLRPTLTHPAVYKTPVSRVTTSKIVNVGINILSFKPPLKWPKVQLVPLRLQWTGAEYHEGWLIPTRGEIKGYMSIFLKICLTCVYCSLFTTLSNVSVSLSAIQLPVFSPDGKRTVLYMTQDFTVITNKKKKNVWVYA